MHAPTARALAWQVPFTHSHTRTDPPGTCRLRELERGLSYRASPVLRQRSFEPATTSRPQPARHQQQQPSSAGIHRTVSAPSRAPGQQPARPRSNVDAKMREVILAEVLDTRPDVRWDDVAGLHKAKQVRTSPDALALIASSLLEPGMACSHLEQHSIGYA